MIFYKDYNLDDDDIQFLIETEDMCINGQSEIILAYKDRSFVLEPHGKEVRVYAYGEVLGDYKNFDELVLKHKIDGKPLIELTKDLEYGD